MCVCQVDRGRQQILTQTCQGGGAKGGTESGLSNWILVIKKTKNKKNGSRVCLRAHLVCVPARVLFKGRDLIGFVCFACREVAARSNFNATIGLKGFRTKGTAGEMEGEGRRYRMR